MTCRFCTLLELIWVSVENREFVSSPSAPSQLAPAAVTPSGNHDSGPFLCEADASATTVAATVTVAIARSGYFRMRPLPPFVPGLPQPGVIPFWTQGRTDHIGRNKTAAR